MVRQAHHERLNTITGYVLQPVKNLKTLINGLNSL